MHFEYIILDVLISSYNRVSKIINNINKINNHKLERMKNQFLTLYIVNKQNLYVCISIIISSYSFCSLSIKAPLAHQKSLSTETLFVRHFHRRRIIRA